MAKLNKEFVRNVKRLSPDPLKSMFSFREHYKTEVVPRLKQTLGLENLMAVPRVEKVTVNMGLGRIFKEEKLFEEAKEILRRITGQEPLTTKARVAIASFKTRVGSPIGLKVTLRGRRMDDFLDRFINMALPRTRDFRGIPSSAVDLGGNLTIGVKEHIIFPETNDIQTKQMYGMEITITTNATSQEMGTALLKQIGFPIQL